jgi:hypothetical protein
MMSGSDSVPPIELPPAEVGRLEEISELVTSCLPSPIRREKLAVAVETEGYIKKLLNVFRMSEDLENTEGLHHLYEIFKNIFLLNKNALFEIMFAEDTIFDVVGCLEYDPGLQSPKRHREYLKSIANFHQVRSNHFVLSHRWTLLLHLITSRNPYCSFGLQSGIIISMIQHGFIFWVAIADHFST